MRNCGDSGTGNTVRFLNKVMEKREEGEINCSKETGRSY